MPEPSSKRVQAAINSARATIPAQPDLLIGALLELAANLTTIAPAIESKLATRPSVDSKIIVDMQFLRDIANLTRKSANLLDQAVYILEAEKNL